MKEETKKNFGIAAILLGAFVVWMAAVQLVDVQPIGPQGSTVGFATVNSWVHNLTGVHMSLYTVTDWLGLVPIAFAIGFCIARAHPMDKEKTPQTGRFQYPRSWRILSACDGGVCPL